MYVLINGAFGVGKSAVAAELRSRLPGAAILNPEYIGFVLQRLPGQSTTDFQDSPAWRKLTISAGRALGWFRSVVIVPMAFSELPYLDEVRRGLAVSGRPVFHFCLMAPLDALRGRLSGRGEPESDSRWAWVHRRAAECCTVHAGPEFAEHVNTVGHSPCAIAETIAGRIRTASQGAS